MYAPKLSVNSQENDCISATNSNQNHSKRGMPAVIQDNRPETVRQSKLINIIQRCSYCGCGMDSSSSSGEEREEISDYSPDLEEEKREAKRDRKDFVDNLTVATNERSEKNPGFLEVSGFNIYNKLHEKQNLRKKRGTKNVYTMNDPLGRGTFELELKQGKYYEKNRVFTGKRKKRPTIDHIVDVVALTSVFEKNLSYYQGKYKNDGLRVFQEYCYNYVPNLRQLPKKTDTDKSLNPKYTKESVKKNKDGIKTKASKLLVEMENKFDDECSGNDPFWSKRYKAGIKKQNHPYNTQPQKVRHRKIPKGVLRFLNQTKK